jgi:hypothetical protein
MPLSPEMVQTPLIPVVKLQVGGCVCPVDNSKRGSCAPGVGHSPCPRPSLIFSQVTRYTSGGNPLKRLILSVIFKKATIAAGTATNTLNTGTQKELSIPTPFSSRKKITGQSSLAEASSLCGSEVSQPRLALCIRLLFLFEPRAEVVCLANISRISEK